MAFKKEKNARLWIGHPIIGLMSDAIYKKIGQSNESKH